MWGRSGRRAFTDSRLDAQPANHHIGRLSVCACSPQPLNAMECAAPHQELSELHRHQYHVLKLGRVPALQLGTNPPNLRKVWFLMNASYCRYPTPPVCPRALHGLFQQKRAERPGESFHRDGLGEIAWLVDVT